MLELIDASHLLKETIQKTYNTCAKISQVRNGEPSLTLMSIITIHKCSKILQHYFYS
jgi:hypothetical protein